MSKKKTLTSLPSDLLHQITQFGPPSSESAMGLVNTRAAKTLHSRATNIETQCRASKQLIRSCLSRKECQEWCIKSECRSFLEQLSELPVNQTRGEIQVGDQVVPFQVDAIDFQYGLDQGGEVGWIGGHIHFKQKDHVYEIDQLDQIYHPREFVPEDVDFSQRPEDFDPDVLRDDFKRFGVGPQYRKQTALSRSIATFCDFISLVDTVQDKSRATVSLNPKIVFSCQPTQEIDIDLEEGDVAQVTLFLRPPQTPVTFQVHPLEISDRITFEITFTKDFARQH